MCAAEVLQVIPRNEAAHAEAHHRKPFGRAEFLINALFEAFGKLINAIAGIIRFELGNMAFDSMIFQTCHKRGKGNPVFEDAMHKNHSVIARLAWLRVAGNGGGEHPGEKLEKAGSHGKISNFKFQLSRKRWAALRRFPK